MNPYALAWTLTAVLGAGLSALLLWEAVLDMRALAGEGNGRLWRVYGRIGAEILRLATHIPFAAIGIAALDSPSNPEARVTVLVLLWGNVALILNSLLQLYVRRRAEPLAVVEAAETIALRAQHAADALVATAATAAAALAEKTEDTGRIADAGERTATATERIADATDDDEVD